MRRLWLAGLLCLPASALAQGFQLRDAGEFLPQGQAVEFYDRFGWRSYQVDFDFGLDDGGKALSKGSRLSLRIVKIDGSHWDYSCKASGTLGANINHLFDGRLSVVADCRIDPARFAKAVDLHPDDVGAPSLMFQAILDGGQASLGAQRGIVLSAARQALASELGSYLASAEDAGGMAVVFQSAGANSLQ